ncbi:MAG: hypothetical protein IPJ87_00335 [Flavobacteriales bacterium]|nr:hypothetical protein [Flavobacteriales bacterium]MBK7940321.1 hypothetical protein [Flavobacteriales bacterium]MBK9699519.1 hypothetical protein [Flavobacteriales bacterium]
MKPFSQPIAVATMLASCLVCQAQIPDHLTNEQKEGAHAIEKEHQAYLESQGRLTKEQKAQADRYNREIERRIPAGETTEYRYERPSANDSQPVEAGTPRTTPTAQPTRLNMNNQHSTSPPPKHLIGEALVFGGFSGKGNDSWVGHAYWFIERSWSDGSTTRSNKVGDFPNGRRFDDSNSAVNEQEYFRKVITRDEASRIWSVARTESESYGYVRENCVDHIDHVARAVGLRTPDRAAWKLPTTYLDELNRLNYEQHRAQQRAFAKARYKQLWEQAHEREKKLLNAASRKAAMTQATPTSSQCRANQPVRVMRAANFK